jgi:type I restriction enzyme M protein
MRSINQANVSASEIKKVQIPLISLSIQQPIADLVNTAFLLQKSSSTDYERAQLLVESELGIDKIDLRKPLGYVAKFGQIETSGRFDAEHFYPEFELLRAKVPVRLQFIKLGGELIYCQRGKQPTYAAFGLPVVNSKHVQPNRVSLERYRKAVPNISSISNIRTGDLLINGTGIGTIGRAAPYLESTVALPDNHVTIVRTRTLDPVYLSVFINSQIGQAQVRKHQRGSSGQLELYPRDIARFEIWKAPEAVQQEIRQLIVNARDARNRSRLLLEEAKTRVEELIKQEVKS